LRHDLESLQRVFHSVKIIKRKLKLLLLYSEDLVRLVIDEKLMDAATVLAAVEQLLPCVI
jgi:hypothetical protein